MTTDRFVPPGNPSSQSCSSCSSSPSSPVRVEPMVARSRDDLLAAVPVILGFHPSESLVMVCCGRRRPDERQFHARVDLPPPRRLDQVDGSVGPLRGAVRRHGVEQVAFVVYTAHPRLARAVSREIEAQFGDVEVSVVLRVHDGRWSDLVDGVEGERRPCDPGVHAFAVRAVVDGTVVHDDRSALAATLAPERSGRAAVAAALADLPPPAGEPAPEETAWAVALVDAASADRPESAATVARLVRLLADLSVRDEVWLRLSRERARELVPWWSDVVRRTPDPLLPDVGFLAAFTAWLSGHGALTWCALDRVLAVAPDHSASHLLAALLDGAVAPSTWADLRG